MNSILRKIRASFRLIFHVVRACISFAYHYLHLKGIMAEIRKDQPMRKFIIINLIEHMGDIVACEPVSRFAKQRHPDSYVIWAVRKPYRELIDSNPFIDKTLVIFCLTEWILFSKTSLFDEIIDLHLQGRVCPACLIPLRKTRGRTELNLLNYYNYGNLLSTHTMSAGEYIPETGPCVYISKQIEDNIDAFDLPRSIITIHCSSNDVSRDWTVDKWIKLLNKLFASSEYHVIEVGSKSALYDYSHPRFIDLCGKTTALETAEIIKRSNLFIGIDSGPAHLANAVSTFGIILLGYYSNFTSYIPYSGSYASGENAIIIRQNGPCADINVDEVFKHARDVVSKTPHRTALK